MPTRQERSYNAVWNCSFREVSSIYELFSPSERIRANTLGERKQIKIVCPELFDSALSG